MLGQIKLENFAGLTTMPQKAASAWSVVKELVGVTYKPLVCIGTQPVRGTNYWFIAEETFIAQEPERRIVKLAVNEFDGVWTLIPNSIEQIF